MTTYTLNGYEREDFNGRETVKPATLALFLPDSVDSGVFRPDGVGSDGLPIYELEFLNGGASEPASLLSINGVALSQRELDGFEVIVVEFISGPYSGVTGMSFYDVERDVDYVFQLGGDAIPLSNISEATEFERYFDSLEESDIGSTVLIEAEGDFAPDEAWDLIDVTDIDIAFKDNVVGTGDAERFEVGRGNDFVNGKGGKDTIEGGNGRDELRGGNAADRIFGGKGNDTLDGGKANDRLTGGNGKDDFIFAKKYGKDIIQDFQDNTDTLVLNDNLWSPDLGPRQVINRFAEQDGDDVVFTFGNKGTLTVRDVTLASLADDIDIV